MSFWVTWAHRPAYVLCRILSLLPMQIKPGLAFAPWSTWWGGVSSRWIKRRIRGLSPIFSSSDLICESSLNTILSITFLAQNFHFIIFHSLIWPKLILLPPHASMNPGFLSATMRLCMPTPLTGMLLSSSSCLPFKAQSKISSSEKLGLISSLMSPHNHAYVNTHLHISANLYFIWATISFCHANYSVLTELE